eukprot:6325517-Pyramimonas_sp.AAC.1
MLRPVFDNVRAALGEVCHIDVHVRKLAAWSKQANACPPGVAERAPDAWVHDRPQQQQGIRILGAPF